MANFDETRRRLLVSAGRIGGGLALAISTTSGVAAAPGAPKPNQEKEVGAVEDLMREHGVLRRALLVYVECVPKLRSDPAGVPATPLAQTARLFRSFGEDYHERKLEEGYIFPAVKKAGGAAAAYVDILKAQHDRGREITEYILGIASKGMIGTADAEPLARALQSFALMYQNHAAREDTIVFPAWKNALSANELDAMGDKFEEIERQTFGKDGFDDAVAQIGNIEQALGFADLSQFTAPPPPKAG